LCVGLQIYVGVSIHERLHAPTVKTRSSTSYYLAYCSKYAGAKGDWHRRALSACCLLPSVPHALPIRRRSDCFALSIAFLSWSLPPTCALMMLPTMTMREPSMSTAKSVPTSGFERLSSQESWGGIGVRERVGVRVGALGPWAIGSVIGSGNCCCCCC
jgi:hypothetical protein